MLDPEAHLHQIAAQVDDGWGEMLHDRRRLLLEQVANIRSVAELTISALGRRSNLLRDALSFISSDGGSSYGRQRPFPTADRAGGDVSDFGLSIAASGLNADTAELDTASNNLSNINTPGYAKEVVNLSPEAAAGPLEAGRGVTVASVSALTDAVYESANVAAEGVQGAADTTNQVMTSIESIFPEPSSDGLSAQLSTFWSDLSTLAANPNQAGAQQTVAADASGLAGALNTTSTQLSDLSASLQSEVGTGSGDSGTLAQANGLLNQVAQLNQGIVAGDSAGQNVNALSDERRSAVDQLAGLLGISTSTAPSGALTINSGGVQLVSGNVAQTLMSTGSAATENLGIATSSGIALQPSGSIGADLTAVNSTLPGYQAQLSAVANALAGNLNTLQANGMDANGDPGCGHRRGLHRDGSAEHLRRPGFGLHLHAQRHVGRHHRRLVRLISQTPRSSPRLRHPGRATPTSSARRRLTVPTRRRWQRWRARRPAPTRSTNRSSARSARRRPTRRAPRPPHRTWPRRPPATWPRSPV